MAKSKDLYVGNLSFETTEDDLRRIFAVAGKVASIHLITDHQSGQSKGCAYVKMASATEAKEAINCLDGARLEHRIITVNEARPQKPKESPGAADSEKPAPKRRPGGRRK